MFSCRRRLYFAMTQHFSHKHAFRSQRLRRGAARALQSFSRERRASSSRKISRELTSGPWRVCFRPPALAALAFSDAANAYGNLEPLVQRFVEARATLHQPPLHKRSSEDVRAELERLQSLPVLEVPASVQRRFVDGGPSGRTHIHIVRPRDLQASFPS